MMIATKTILIVDDEPRTWQGLHRMLEAWGGGRIGVRSAASAIEALELLKRESVNLIITDIRMPEMSGLHLTDALPDSGGRKPAVILISGHAEFEYAQRGLQLGVVDYLLKPIARSKLLQAVEQALEAEERHSRALRLERIADARLLAADAGRPAVGEAVQAAVRYVEEHLHEPFGMSQVAAHVHLNASYFSALFKEQMRMTFSEYVTRARLQKAKELLLQTKRPIVEIAELVGYQTAKYFIRLFKEYEGMSPGQYRSEVAGQPDIIQK